MPYAPRWIPPTAPFTHATMEPLGVTPEMLRWAHRTGRVTRLVHGVFIATDALAAEPVARHLQLAQAHQLRNPRSIAAFQTAALAWDLDLDDVRAAADGPPRFITPPSGPARSTQSIRAVTAVRRLPVAHRVAHPSGLVVTTPARTALDVAAESPLGGALVALDSFARAALTDLVGARGLRAAYLDEGLLARTRRPLLEALPHTATRSTRRWLEEVVPQADPRREAASESLSYALIVGAGLPAPTLQARIQMEDGDVYPDFLWDSARVIGEVDGAVKYGTPEALVREKRRQERLERLGYLVVRWMADEVRRRPGDVVQRLAWALAQRG